MATISKYMTLDSLWKLVNDIETIEDVNNADYAIRANDWLSIQDFEELMGTVAYRSREIYRQYRR